MSLKSTASVLTPWPSFVPVPTFASASTRDIPSPSRVPGAVLGNSAVGPHFLFPIIFDLQLLGRISKPSIFFNFSFLFPIILCRSFRSINPSFSQFSFSFFIFHFSFFIIHFSFFSARGPLAWLASLTGTSFGLAGWHFVRP